MTEPAPEGPLSLPDRSNIGSRVAASAALLWGTSVALRLAQLATTAILARVLTPEDYGIIALATTITGFVDLLSNLQVGGAIIKTQNLEKAHLDTAFTIGLIRGTVTAAALVLFSDSLASYMSEPRLAPVLCVLAVPCFLTCIVNPYLILFARNLNFFEESKRQGAATLAGAVAGVGAAFVLRNYWAIVVASTTTSAVSLLLSYWSVPGTPRLGLSKTREILSYGIWLIAIAIMDFVNGKVDYFLIGTRLGSQVLGAYHVGQQVTMMATGDVVTPLSRALFPAFSQMTSDMDRLRQSYRAAQSTVIALALPVGFGISAVAHDIVYLLVGPQWGLAIKVIVYLSPLIALQTLLASIETIALTMNRGRVLVIRTAIFLVLRLTLLFVGYKMGGVMGIIYARLFTGSFYLVYGLGLAAKLTQTRLLDPIAASWRSIVSVIVMYAVVVFIPDVDFSHASSFSLASWLIVKIAAGGVSYVIVHTALWRLARKPDGAERRLLDSASKVASRLKAPLLRWERTFRSTLGLIA